jgi:1-acyl-sn-glycerol-3-phosphate acyltransferase
VRSFSGAYTPTFVPTEHSSSHPGVIDPAAVDRYAAVMGPIIRRMWPVTFHDLDRLSHDDRILIVANHSGMGAAELWTLALHWYERFGVTRPVAGMAHPAGFRVPILREALQGMGAVEATRVGAAKARQAGVPLLLFPGGDVEATRPFWQADRVDFGGRKGWIRLAREHGLTIVPLCISGSHVTLPILASGRAISWLTGLRALGTHRAPLPALAVLTTTLSFVAARALGFSRPVSLFAAWASVWPTVMLPWVPSRIGFHFLPPIPAAEIAAADDDALYDRVVGALGRTLREENARTRAERASVPSRPLVRDG